MTANKHFKQLVRARMAVAGETYTAARTSVESDEVDVVLSDPVVVEVHGRHGQTVVFTPDGTRVLSGGQDARIAILDAATGATQGELLGHSKVVNAVGVTPDGRLAVAVSSDRTVRIWDLDTRSSVGVLDGHRDAVVAPAVSPDGAGALTGGYDGRLLQWDLAEHVCVGEVRTDLKRLAAVAYTPDGTCSIESGQGPRVTVRATDSNETLAVLDTGAPGVIGLDVSADGAMLATAGYDGTVALWDCTGWEEVRRLDVGDRASAVSFSRSGRLLAVAARRKVTVWSHDRDTPIATAGLPIDGVYDLAFSPDARRLAQAGADGKVRIWTLR
ncbi:MAG: WD40 repeat domain-containing protein [Egibacteraceae bacterium]